MGFLAGIAGGAGYLMLLEALPLDVATGIVAVIGFIAAAALGLLIGILL